jgi:hypothetical protein
VGLLHAQVTADVVLFGFKLAKQNRQLHIIQPFSLRLSEGILFWASSCLVQLLLQSSVFWDAIQWDQTSVLWETIHQPLLGGLSISFFVANNPTTSNVTSTTTTTTSSSSSPCPQQQQLSGVPAQGQTRQQQLKNGAQASSSLVPKQGEQQHHSAPNPHATPYQERIGQEQQQQQPQSRQHAVSKRASPNSPLQDVGNSSAGVEAISSSHLCSEEEAYGKPFCQDFQAELGHRTEGNTQFDKIHCTLLIVDGAVKLLTRWGPEVGKVFPTSPGLNNDSSSSRFDNCGRGILQSCAPVDALGMTAPAAGSNCSTAAADVNARGAPTQQQQQEQQKQQHGYQSHVQLGEQVAEDEVCLDQHPAARAGSGEILFLEQLLQFDQLLPLTVRQLKVRSRGQRRSGFETVRMTRTGCKNLWCRSQILVRCMECEVWSGVP